MIAVFLQMILFCRYIWPLEAKLVCHDYVYDGTRLALAEMLLGGTTCINDMCAAVASNRNKTKATLSFSTKCVVCYAS